MSKARSQPKLSQAKPQTVGGHYRLTDYLGGGAFGQVYKCVVQGTNEEHAVKLEPLNARPKLLGSEIRIYKLLAGGSGVPNIKWHGKEGNYTVMVMDYLGENLESLRLQMPEKKFSLKTVIMIADQLIRRIEYLHSKDFIHQDIKPENFVIGRDKKDIVVYIIDLGLATPYMDGSKSPPTHIPWSKGKGLVGTMRYCSLHAHLEEQQSRRDDVEALGYVLIYLAKGSLPWQGNHNMQGKEKFQWVHEMKRDTPLSKLCEGLPEEFQRYMDIARNLRYDETPPYFELRRLFRSIFVRMEFELDFVFDWSNRHRKQDSRLEDRDGREKSISDTMIPQVGVGEHLNQDISDVNEPQQIVSESIFEEQQQKYANQYHRLLQEQRTLIQNAKRVEPELPPQPSFIGQDQNIVEESKGGCVLF